MPPGHLKPDVPKTHAVILHQDRDIGELTVVIIMLYEGTAIFKILLLFLDNICSRFELSRCAIQSLCKIFRWKEFVLKSELF